MSVAYINQNPEEDKGKMLQKNQSIWYANNLQFRVNVKTLFFLGPLQLVKLPDTNFSFYLLVYLIKKERLILELSAPISIPFLQP